GDDQHGRHARLPAVLRHGAAGDPRPACDADRTADGTCTFRVSVCLDQADAAFPLCTATGSSGYQVRKLGPTSRDPADKANGLALVNSLTALGGTATGTKQNDVHFRVPLAAPTCTALASIDVPLKIGKATTKTLRGCGELGKCVDVDKLRLHCLPASSVPRDVTAWARDPRPGFSLPPPRRRQSTR